MAIPISSSDFVIGSLIQILDEKEENVEIASLDLPISYSESLLSPAQAMQKAVIHLLSENSFPAQELLKLVHEIPHYWEKHGDLVMFPAYVFQSPAWSSLGKLSLDQYYIKRFLKYLILSCCLVNKQTKMKKIKQE